MEGSDFQFVVQVDLPREMSAEYLVFEIRPYTPDDQPWLASVWKYKTIGLALLAYTAKLSQDLGYGGSFGLHASSEDALDFYRRVASGRNPELFHPETTGILGPTPHGNPGDLGRTYLETHPQGAINLLEDYRHA